MASASSRVANLSRAFPGVTVDTFQKEFVSALSTQMESDGMAVRRREPTDDEIEASATAATLRYRPGCRIRNEIGKDPDV